MTESQPSVPTAPHSRDFRVAIVAWQALPAVIPESSRNVGGLETAAWLLARGLARQASVECSFFVRSDAPMKPVAIDGVDVIPDVDPREPVRRDVAKTFEQGIGGAIRRFRPRLLWQIPYLAATRPWRRPDPEPRQPDPRLSNHHPDAWITLGVSRESAGVIATAKHQGRPSVLMIQSNADLDSRYASDSTFRNRYGETSENCLYAIEHADRVVCQTRHQLDLLGETFHREGLLIRNAIDLDRWTPATRDSDLRVDPHVLWIGRYDDFHKRPHLAMEIAEQCPDIPFRMIINPSDPDVQQRLLARCPPNVTIKQYIPNADMPKTMARCSVFLSTGSAQFEGFPNVLLQATASGIPIVSLDDFDGYLANSGAGIHADDDVDAAARSIRELFAGTRTIDHDRSRRYLQQHHDVDAIVSALQKQLSP